MHDRHYNGEQLTLFEELRSGNHERCKYCHKPFPEREEGGLQRLRALDGHFYCNKDCASAYQLRAGWTI
jgi:hypothetical protein